ncbi:unnamed protein product [Prunus armeniaca]|uniref:Uncharacterized protein n=1 Tax=Prunus armeniaca TaxID=36596 RepID=A0A6J5USL5_PRUAR|nr:unnamed protein product [Prunus armeniaca]
MLVSFDIVPLTLISECLGVSSPSDYVDLEFHPILPSSAPGPTLTTSASDQGPLTQGTSLVRLFPPAVVTSPRPTMPSTNHA